ncbi:integral membrane protein DGCR2/IDD-like [Antedon mediterranea]|uniref:integral membrane protein DGCR2/IDD-like n=1 Tax=Antedon mediterranea TaxID=105859 RepID=UPI003AF4C532
MNFKIIFEKLSKCVMMTAIGLVIAVNPSFVLCSLPVPQTTPQAPSETYVRRPEYHLSGIRIEEKCPDGWINSNLKQPSCYKFNKKAVSFGEAEKACHETNAHLATAENDLELKFLGLLVNAWKEPPLVTYWIGYQYSERVNSSNWSEVNRDQPLNHQQAVMLEVHMIDHHSLSDPAFLNDTRCGYVSMRDGPRLGIDLTSCNNEIGYVCKKDVDYICFDGLDKVYKSGDRFKPVQSDPCISCTCGESTMCSSASCALPSCNDYTRSNVECCGYTCKGGDNGKNIETNMQWMLTMAFSFFILGVVLIMIYRMRQRRMAYLRILRDREHLQQLSQVDFEVGCGPPPPPDEFDGLFQSPPPPYRLCKDENTDLPPPYEHLTINRTPTVNANNRKIEDTRETVTLLGDSEPSTPSVQSAELTLSDRQTHSRQEDVESLNSPSDHSTTTTPTGSIQDGNSSTGGIYQTSV